LFSTSVELREKNIRMAVMENLLKKKKKEWKKVPFACVTLDQSCHHVSRSSREKDQKRNSQACVLIKYQGGKDGIAEIKPKESKHEEGHEALRWSSL
jgi:hypothetical protein